MVITDSLTVLNTLDNLLDNKECYIAVDRNDIVKLFGAQTKLRMIQVAANTVDEVISLLKQDIAKIEGHPKNCFAAYISMDLKMSDLERLGSVTDSDPNIQCMKRTIIFEKSPLGDFLLLLFFD